MKIKGDTCESLASSCLHERGVPVLISPNFLRRNECGQVDLCIVSKESECKLYELKSYYALSSRQSSRLIKSGRLISSILGIKVDCFAWFFKDEEIFPIN